MKYFFHSWNDFAKAIKNKHILLLFDFDGTLSPIASKPIRAKLSAPTRGHLKRLSKNKRISIGIVSGRGLKDVMRHAGVKGIYYAGNHGLEVKGPKGLFVHPACKKYKPYIKKMVAALRRNISGIKGPILEHKRLSLSLHYRLVPEKNIIKLKSIFMKICAPYIKSGKVKLTKGKKVFEIRPPVAWDKGKAVKKIEEMTGRKKALKLFIGDDVTDEDAFKVLKNNDFSIRVGRKKTSKAKYFLKNTADVRRLVMKISKITALIFIVSSLITTLQLSSVYAEEEAAQKVVTEESPKKPPIIGALFDIISDEPDDLDTDNYSTRTEDGWEISIKRYIAEENKDPKAAVILCHGFNINGKFWDLDRRCSPARYLAKNGYDVWVPDLRGSGRSSKTNLARMRSIFKFELREIPHMLVKAPFDMTKFGWTIDDHIHKDVPAIINLVKKESGFEKVYWIGHSMGGIIMFGYLETETQEDIAGFIPLASMMVIHQPLNAHQKRIANQKSLMTASLIINTSMASQLSNYTFGAVKSPIEEMLLKRENMHNEVTFRFFRTCIDDTSAGVVSQFSDSIKTGKIVSSDREYNYTDNMGKITVPILFMAGGADGFVTKKAMRDSYNRVSSRDKNIVIFSKANGYSADYGHCDLVIGKNSEQDVYPEILRWLDERTVGIDVTSR